MTPQRAEKSAQVVLIAMHRAWAREGAFPLSPAEIASRIGLKSSDHLEPGVLELMIFKGWVLHGPSGYELTPEGLEIARNVG